MSCSCSWASLCLFPWALHRYPSHRHWLANRSAAPSYLSASHLLSSSSFTRLFLLALILKSLQYFSTLERLRFAQDAAGVEGIYNHYDDISNRNNKRPNKLRRRSLNESCLAPSLSLANLPDKIKRREFSREDQVVLAKHLRASVILDAADEAIYRKRASRLFAPISATALGPDINTPSLSRQPSMDSLQSENFRSRRARDSEVPESFYESFRCLDEDEDLDLRLFLDDYHANLRETLPKSQKKELRPSFRRHLSVTGLPFGRPSVSSSRPATKDTDSTPASPLTDQPPTSVPTPPLLSRRKSRTLSLITPRHASRDSVISVIDPAASHYQDPEARLKLRVYLASPQKFDEAIEFGFPSTKDETPIIGKDVLPPRKRQSRQNLTDDDNLRSFLADTDDEDDDEGHLDSDQETSPDSDAPKTPHPYDMKSPMRVAPEHIHARSTSDGYIQAHPSSREMTLRMTLTRPDLRANEEQLYGWQQGRKSMSPLRDLGGPSAAYLDARPKQSIENMLNGPWTDEAADQSVMKRFWNRVRRS